MVSANRELTLAGYEVYRFGGKELYHPFLAKSVIKRFFRMLFDKYGLIIK